jgi:hypothetical protein
VRLDNPGTLVSHMARLAGKPSPSEPSSNRICLPQNFSVVGAQPWNRRWLWGCQRRIDQLPLPDEFQACPVDLIFCVDLVERHRFKYGGRHGHDHNRAAKNYPGNKLGSVDGVDPNVRRLLLPLSGRGALVNPAAVAPVQPVHPAGGIG